MSKKAKESQVDLYYMNNGQANRELIEDVNKRKKSIEREKRIKENNRKRNEAEFDLETETVIQMTNRNKIKKEEQKRRELTKEEKEIKELNFS